MPELSIGPLLYWWPREALLNFYADMADAPVRSIVYGLVNERLEFFFEENPKHARTIIEKTMQAQRAREGSAS